VEQAFARLFALLWEFLLDSTPARRRRKYGDMEYDWENRLDTTAATVSGRTRLLGLLNSPYQPVEPAFFREMMNVLPIEFEKFTFLDIGSGKGRALLLAAERRFRRIIGVELLPELNEIARENAKRFSTARAEPHAIDTICADATEYELPRDPLVVYLFNPLPQAGLRKLASNLERSLSEHPRSCYVIYANPELGYVFEGKARVRKVAGTPQFSVFCFEEPGIDESRKG
jgi:SAM-dependent methyltransferase